MAVKPESALADSMLNVVAWQELIDWRENAAQHVGETATQTVELATT